LSKELSVADRNLESQIFSPFILLQLCTGHDFKSVTAELVPKELDVLKLKV
jgi:hypothetical protein